MKILYVITQAEVGGAQKYTLDLAKHFKGTIVSGTESNQLETQSKAVGVTYIGLPEIKRDISPLSDVKAIIALRTLYKKEQPDIVHLNSSMAGFLGSLAGIGLNIKIIYTAHGFVFNEPLPWYKKHFYIFLEWLASHFRDAVITVSEADRLSAITYHIAPKEKLITIHNGIGQINFFDRETARKQFNLPTDTFILGTIANAYHTKGIDLLLTALSQLPKDLKLHYVLIGSGVLLETYKKQARELGLQDKVSFLGKIPEASRYLKTLDGFVLPSRKEGFPYTILEALQAGLPIIASNVGGVPEAIGIAGLTYNPNDLQTLSHIITELVTDKQLQNKLSEATKQRSELFSLRKTLEETQIVYTKLLS